jgi:hypothetical protein
MLQYKRYLGPLAFVLLASGCGGLELRKGEVGKEGGYQLYLPKVLLTVSSDRRCREPDAEGNCPNNDWEIVCQLGEPWMLPDYAKPYVARFKPGIGSQSASLEVVNGWLLGAATSESDVTDLPITMLGQSGISTEEPNTCKEGIYEWTADGFKLLLFPGAH